MFANLKNKLIEEVKASPSKFQQFANAAQAAVSSSSSTTPSGSESTTTTTNENFFSITEEDTPQNSPYKPLKLPSGAVRGRAPNISPQSLNNGTTGAIPRTRKLSNSSMASDISFRLPSYDTSSLYHAQSDLDISASEVEDSASSVKLETITKEHLYDAYRKSLDRYHKYRCRYTDLAKKYKDLERDSSKARSVLVETQEKAIRRISELREQCSLEQQAKAHLEEALRVEMDDMQCKMQAYQTKLKLLGENPEQIAAALAANGSKAAEDSLIDLNSNANATNNLISLETNFSSNEDTTAKIRDLEKQLVEREMQLQEMATKLKESTETIEMLRKQEEENALFLAQTKQAIHSELESKDSEVKQLQVSIKKLQSDLQNAMKRESQFMVQETELTELRDKLKSVQSAKKEVDAKVIAADHLLSELREKFTMKEKALIAAEEKILNLTKESEQKFHDLRQQNAQLSGMIERYQRNEISLAEIDNELNRTKNENDTLRATMEENQRQLQELNSETASIRELLLQAQLANSESEEKLKISEKSVQEFSKQLEELRLEKENQEQRVKQLETEMRILGEQNATNESETVATLKEELRRTNNELNEQLKIVKEQLVAKEKEVKAITNKLTKQKKQHETQQAKSKEQMEQIEKLKEELVQHERHLETMQNESREREEQTEKEKLELKQQVTNILREISQMEEQMRLVQQSHSELEEEKRRLEMKIEDMQQQSRDEDETAIQLWREQLMKTEGKLQQVEVKLQNVESENSQLAEKNCLLEENANRLEKIIAERERHQSLDETIVNDMRLKLETAEGTIQKLNEKMSQVLDENSRMHNAQELSDHDYRTLQDKYDALEKEKLLLIDEQKCIQDELKELKDARTIQEAKFLEIVEKLRSTEDQLTNEKSAVIKTEQELKDLKILRDQQESESVRIREQLRELNETHSDDAKLKELLKEKQERIEELSQQEQYNTSKLQDAERELKILEKKLQEAEQLSEEYEKIKLEVLLLQDNNKSLNDELSSVTNDLEQKQSNIENLEIKLQDFNSSYLELGVLKESIEVLKTTLTDREHELDELKKKENELEIKLKCANEAIEEHGLVKQKLNEMHVMEKGLRKELNDIKIKYKSDIEEMEKTLQQNRIDMAKLQETKEVLEVQLEKLRDENQAQVTELDALVSALRKELKDNAAKTQETMQEVSKYEQLQLENEYLNKHVKQLEFDLEQQKISILAKHSDSDELKEKLKSIQCELYVFRENAEKHSAEIEEKQEEIKQTKAQLTELQQIIDLERVELKRQTDHAKYITEQNDIIQKELLHAQQQLADLERKHDDTTRLLNAANEEISSLNTASALASEVKAKQIEELREEIDRSKQTIEVLNKEVADITAELQVKEKLEEELNVIKVERTNFSHLEGSSTNNETIKATQNDSENLRKINAILQNELEDLKHKSTSQISNLQQEIEDMQITAKHMTEKMAEYERLRLAEQHHSPINNSTTDSRNESTEKEELEAKLRNIMQEVQDVSNRNLFLEQKCENFLILEQSNERLKSQNAKLSRQLDETLVSMQHNESITANTEFEYLKNIMFQYLTGSANGNNETLVKVISAVLKFSPQQTQVALEKEHQRRSLLNKIL